MNSEELKLIKEMMDDVKNQSSLYLQSYKRDYLKYYEKNILKQIKKNDLTKFRSWPGGAGVGNIQSFGGGEEELSRNFKRNFHPFDSQYYKFRFLDSLNLQLCHELIQKFYPDLFCVHADLHQ